MVAAAVNGHRDVAALLLAKGAGVDKSTTVNGRGMTPLCAAAGRGHLAIVDLLLSKGADVNIADHMNGCTPLMFAAVAGHCAMMDLLLTKGADIDHTRGCNALHYAVMTGGLPAVEVLLSRGANVDQVEENTGGTAQHLAALHKSPSIVQLLLSRGADARAVPKHGPERGRTPADVAARRGHHDVSALLLSWSTRPAAAPDTPSTASGRAGDERGVAGGVEAELPCQGKTTAGNPAVAVIESAAAEEAERAESAAAEEAESAEIAAAEGAAHRLADQLSRSSCCSDVGGLSDAMPPHLQPQRCGGQGGEGALLAVAVHAHDVCDYMLVGLCVNLI